MRAQQAALGMNALKSIAHVVPVKRYTFNIVIITDVDSRFVVEAKSAEAASKGFFANAENYTVIVEPVLFYNGHIQQKYSKMTADLYTNAEYLLHVDSDVRFHSWDEDCFFGGLNHKPLLEYAPWHFLPLNARQWANGSKALLGLDTIDFEFSRANQHVYPRALYKKLRSRIEFVEGMRFKDVFRKYPLVGTLKDVQQLHRNGNLNALLVSDFNLLGGYVHYFEPGLMHTIDVSVPRNPIHDPPRASCVSQCNSRMHETTCCKAWFDSMDKYQHDARYGHLNPIQGYNCAPFLNDVAPLKCPFVIVRDAMKKIQRLKYGISDCTHNGLKACTHQNRKNNKCPYATLLELFV